MIKSSPENNKESLSQDTTNQPVKPPPNAGSPPSISDGPSTVKSLFILSGQSNSWGLGKITDLDSQAFDPWRKYRTMDFRKLNFSFFETYEWRADISHYPLINKLHKGYATSQFESLSSKFANQHEWNNTSADFDSEFGQEIGIAASTNNNKTNEIYKQSYPGYSISQFLSSYYEENRVKSDGSDLLTHVFSNLNSSVKNNDKSHVFFVWYQGESDAIKNRHINYDQNLENLLSLVRNKTKRFFPKAQLWNIIISIHANPPIDTETFPTFNWQQIRQKQQSVVLKTEPDTVMLKSELLPLAPDGIHLNTEAQLALGECVGFLSNILAAQTSPLQNDSKIYQCQIQLNGSEKSGALTGNNILAH